MSRQYDPLVPQVGSTEKRQGGSPRGRESIVRHLLAGLVAAIPDPLVAARPDGRCFYLDERLVSSDTASGELVLREGEEKAELVLCLGDDEEQRFEAVVAPIEEAGAVVCYVAVVCRAGGTEEGRRDLLSSLFQLAPELVCVFEPSGRPLYTSPSTWRILGYAAGEEPADGLFRIVHGEDAHALAGAVAATTASSGERVFVRLAAADGTFRLFEGVTKDLRDEPGVGGIGFWARDVTEESDSRLELLEANERLSTLVSSLHLAVLVEDERRQIVFTNDAFVSLFEVPLVASELAGRTVEELGPEFYRRFGDPTIPAERERTEEVLRARRPVIGDRLVMPDNRVIERDYLPILAGGEYRGHVWLFRDVSAQALVEAEWDELLASQREKNERLLELDRIKSAFLAEISHELRTPLTSILSFTELLQDGVGREDENEQSEFLEIIRRNAERLVRLVDDLLFLDRIETGAMPLEWGEVDVAEIAEGCVAAFQPAAEEKSLTLRLEASEGPPLRGDAGRLSQVLDVLVSNAIKFTPEGGEVVVTAAASGSAWQIEVADTGMGVPPEERESLFERFYRATNARAARIPGSGLGLAVARAIVELHGGSVALASTGKTGTTVRAELPLDKTALYGGADEV